MPLARDTVVGVVGAGTMGAGIALVAASHGHRVVLADAIPAALDRGRAAIAKSLARQVEKGTRTQGDADAIAARITSVAGTGEAQWAEFAPCGLVIEAVIEDATLKKAVFAALERVVPPDAVLGTNTSSLSVASIGAACRHPGRVVGIHFFNPAPVMPLVEIVGALTTDPAVTDEVRAFVDRLGQDHRPGHRYAGLHRQPDRAAVLWRGAPHRRGGAGRLRHDRLGDAGIRRVQDGAVRTHGLHRQ